jgi:hypothetical protein
MKFTLEIELGNEAMQAPLDVDMAVEKSLDNFDDFTPFNRGDSGILRDRNGNRVGGWKVTL